MLNNFSVGGTKLRGKIDRIELDEDEKFFSIVDYKLSGKKPSADDLFKGLSLQLPVYMIASKEILQKQFNNEFHPAGAYIYSLKYNENDFGRMSVGKSRTRDFNLVDENKKKEITEYYYSLMEASINNIIKYVDNIKVGKFNLSSVDNRETKVCTYCKYKPICRIQVVK